MKTRLSVLGALVVLLAFAMILPSTAGPEKITFPDYTKHVLYYNLDRPDVKQVRDLYVNPEALKPSKDGEPLPYGTTLTIVVFKAKLDEAGNPLKDDKGRFIKGDLALINVMEKRQGLGAEYADDIRNGEWEYASFRADGSRVQHDFKPCFACHKPMANTDYVFTYYNVVEFPKSKIR